MPLFIILVILLSAHIIYFCNWNLQMVRRCHFHLSLNNQLKYLRIMFDFVLRPFKSETVLNWAEASAFSLISSLVINPVIKTLSKICGVTTRLSSAEWWLMSLLRRAWNTTSLGFCQDDILNLTKIRWVGSLQHQWQMKPLQLF